MKTRVGENAAQPLVIGASDRDRIVEETLDPLGLLAAEVTFATVHAQELPAPADLEAAGRAFVRLHLWQGNVLFCFFCRRGSIQTGADSSLLEPDPTLRP